MENKGSAAEVEGIVIDRRGAAAVITLDRAGALNALSIPMRGQLREALSGLGRDPQIYAVVLKSAVAKAFSVGGDVREMTGLAASDLTAARQGLADELRLCWVAECLSKPTVSLVDGLVMGTGVGITLYNTHRVAGAGYRFSMPETQIGYFPDCGVAHTFARMPHGLGFYLGLTGHAIGRADALALGLVTHCIDREHFEGIETQLADADPVDPLLDGLHVAPDASPLLAQGRMIERFFGAPDLAGIMDRLRQAHGDDRAFAAESLALLEQRSPTALAVTDRMIRSAAHMDLREALIQDYRLAHRFAALPDFREGVRAHLIEKDGRPRWQPERLADVTSALIENFFAPLGASELVLATREEMQAART